MPPVTNIAQTHPIAGHLNMVNKRLNDIARRLKVNKLELLIMLTYPMIIILGQLIWLVAPAESSMNYFTSKKNIFNVYFVKQGWFWTTLVFGLFLFSVMRDSNVVRKQHGVVSCVKKFASITACWFFFSQWFFGMPIMDRIFVLTGGSCYNVSAEKLKNSESFKLMDFTIEDLAEYTNQDNDYYYSSSISSRQCRSMRGRWYGGHDPSGHVFLLSLSTTFLMTQLFEFYNSITLRKKLRQFKIDSENYLKNREFVQFLKSLFLEYPVVLLLMLVGLWLWMLLNTTIYFHSLLENLAGLFFSYLASLLSFQI
ncbi:unnamed protein product [Ambrosiozyma monospora]|uniref:Unnamed protein product n=1 Tax=Ambrosiozyma monospora TaxID=43982 RepID=A0ACB5T218_AMBMO|nr:unnamed protein product [Ambrosiozyma monospora]